MSRNRLIIRAVERVLEDTGEAWPEGFAERLTAVSPDEAATVDDLLTAVQRARRSKPPVTL